MFGLYLLKPTRIVALIVALTTAATAQNAEPPEIQWREWNDQLFTDAAETGRYILLDLNARWCHWCHFMEERTYAHPSVRQLVADGYLATKVDQDANPDLAARYGDWGWPATIIFDPNGNEVAKLQGFQRPSRMSGILYTVLAQPENIPALLDEPDVVASQTEYLNDDQRAQLLAIMDATYDAEFAGWGMRLKFLQPGVIEYAMDQAQLGETETENRLRATLDAALTLIDPVWGGTYQYSHLRDWSAPHFEKIMAFQANGISLYARAYAQFGDPAYLAAAESIADYLLVHLQSPDGAFFTSQDADVNSEILGAEFYALNQEERTALGLIPPIDPNLYARENSWAARGMIDLYAITGNHTYLDAAKSAVSWIIANRSLPGGGFSHGEADKGGPYLSDNIAMAEALLNLYMADGDTQWLTHAATAADFISANFAQGDAGFGTAKQPRVNAAAFSKPHMSIEENISVARFANLLAHTHGDDRFKDIATHAMKFLTSDAITARNRFMLGTVLADQELSIEPPHIAIVGGADDPTANALHSKALGLPLGYVRIDRWDPKTGPMFNPNVEYPELDQAAAYACANNVCSLPVFAPEDLARAVRRTMGHRILQR